MASDIKRIDLSDWEQTGGGMLGTSYFHKKDPHLMLKLSNGDAPLEVWRREIDNARAFIAVGLPTPKPGSIVFDGEHYGLVFERIADKISYAAAVGKTSSDEEIDALARKFAADVRLLHSTVCNGSGLRNVKDVIRENILRNTVRSGECIDAALRLLGSLPDGDTAIHGDLHFGNMITAAGKDYFIDLGDAAYGDNRFDMAMFAWVVAMCEGITEERHRGMYHHSFAQTHRFYNTYLDAYFGRPTDAAAFEAEMMPYIALRLLCIESNVGRAIPGPINSRIDTYLETLVSGAAK